MTHWIIDTLRSKGKRWTKVDTWLVILWLLVVLLIVIGPQLANGKPRKKVKPCEVRIKENFNKFCLGGGCARHSVDRITPRDCFHLPHAKRLEAAKP